MRKDKENGDTGGEMGEVKFVYASKNCINSRKSLFEEKKVNMKRLSN